MATSNQLRKTQFSKEKEDNSRKIKSCDIFLTIAVDSKIKRVNIQGSQNYGQNQMIGQVRGANTNFTNTGANL